MPHTVASTYATQRAPLAAQISSILADSTPTPVDFRVMAAVVPNYDNLSGGSHIAEVYKSLPDNAFDTVISIAPNSGEPFKRITVCSLDSYNSPLGDVPVDDGVRNELCDEDDDIYLDDRGHYTHTGVDVQLPFLQRVLGEFSIVPLVMGVESPEFCKELGHAVGEIMTNKRTLVVACAEVEAATEKGLELFRKHLTNLDVTSMMVLLNQEQEIRVKGKGPILVAMIASAHRRANAVSFSGLTAPTDSQPGFAGALIGRF